MPFGVNSDPSFRAQKRSIRVRVSTFRTTGTVGPKNRETEKPKIKKAYMKVVRDSCLWDSGRWE